MLSRPVERSAYVLLSSLLLLLLFWQWRPMSGVVWSVENTVGYFALQALFWVGWLIVLLSTFLINHFDLFGLRQVYLRLRGLEERDLVSVHGESYKEYQRQVSMLIPLPKKR